MATVTFASSVKNLKLIRVPMKKKWINETDFEFTEEVSYVFNLGKLEVDANDKDLLSWLRRHPLLGLFKRGFFEVKDPFVMEPAPKKEEKVVAKV